MRTCYSDIINKTENTIAANSANRAKELQEVFSEEKIYDAFISAVSDVEKKKKKQEEVENLLNDLL